MSLSSSPTSFGWKAGHPPTGLAAKRTHPPLFDALTATAHDLQKLLTAGELKSTDLVEEYVWRIEEYNPYLRAVSQYAPGVLDQAKELDSKRAAGEVLGPLHGIPILLKNSISTDASFGMDTTGGAVALIGAVSAKNAAVVDKLIEAGAVILGKTSCSELNYYKGSGLLCGWSALDGQGQSPYVRGGVVDGDSIGGHSVPGGSSSGVSIAVSAGLAAGGVGSDTEGSIIAPAVRTSLYSIRPSLGIAPADGIIPLAHSFDTLGPIAKDVKDLADILSVIVDNKKTTVPSDGYSSALESTWTDCKVGTLSPDDWNFPDFLVKPVLEATVQIKEDTKARYGQIQKLAGAYHDSVDLPSVNVELPGDIEVYLKNLTSSNVRSLQELVDWNTAHSEDALPPGASSQSLLVQSLNTKISPEDVAALHDHRRKIAANLDTTFKKYDINIILGPGDSPITQYAVANGYPAAALPLSYLDFNGRPIGLVALVSGGQELHLLKFLKLYEQTFPARRPPSAFLSESGAKL
ncbi:hypothetical protein VF21_05228 [Pseudogymnoascus sp. 05NY08]|nr:hypothetical protein VF21_05228 [Pseudogymnoascus sp. 05NY08]